MFRSLNTKSKESTFQNDDVQVSIDYITQLNRYTSLYDAQLGLCPFHYDQDKLTTPKNSEKMKLVINLACLFLPVLATSASSEKSRIEHSEFIKIRFLSAGFIFTSLV